jgi:hypothetical protein
MMAHGLVLSLHRAGHGHSAAIASVAASGVATALAAAEPIKADRIDGSLRLEPTGIASVPHEQAFCTACAALSSLEHSTVPAPFATRIAISLTRPFFAPYTANSRASTTLPFSRAPPVNS